VTGTSIRRGRGGLARYTYRVRRWWCTALLGFACGRALPGPPTTPLLDHRRAGELPVDVARLAAAAEAAPADVEAQRAAGMAHLRATLAGDLRQRDAAERFLSRALDLAPDATETARVLARLLNLRSSELDFARVPAQLELYDRVQPGEVDIEAPIDAFAIDCFRRAARAMLDYDRGRLLSALVGVRALERRMAERVERSPLDVDAHTMAATYALGFLAVLPFGDRRRLAQTAEHLEVQQAHWDRLAPGARDESVAPNVRAVWSFVRAEVSTALGDTARARPAYRAVIEQENRHSEPSRQLAAAARERLGRLEDYSGRAELVPVWPAGAAGCIACHATNAAIPTEGRFLLRGVAQ
jgi:transposase